MPELIRAFETGADLRALPGLAFPTGQGTVERTEQKAYMPKADTLPFPRRDLVRQPTHRLHRREVGDEAAQPLVARRRADLADRPLERGVWCLPEAA